MATSAAGALLLPLVPAMLRSVRHERRRLERDGARSPPVLEAQETGKRHYPVSGKAVKPKALARALDGVSFTLSAGKTLAVVGESAAARARWRGS